VIHFKILGTRMVTWSKFHTEDSQMLLSGDFAIEILMQCVRGTEQFTDKPRKRVFISKYH